ERKLNSRLHTAFVNQNEQKTVDQMRCDAVTNPHEEMMAMRENMEEMMRELSVTREINHQVVTISLSNALKELEELREKKKELLEQVSRNQPMAGTTKEAEELKKRNARLMQDNVDLKQTKELIAFVYSRITLMVFS
ncbi:hypothetical protein PENTCL1PPCAC_27516, partial [Pristionchus entomophagus]